MSGHSHWARIRHKKAVSDARKGKLFSKLAMHVTSAARIGGGDPNMNLKLRYAIDKAKAQGMPMDNIERAVKKGTGELGGAAPEELVYEGIGPLGVNIILDAVTDNRNRTTAELRKIFERRGGNLGKAGCVSWNFESKGRIGIERTAIHEDTLLELSLEAGAEDVQVDEDVYNVLTSPDTFEAVKRSLRSKDLTFKVCELTRIPKSLVSVADEKGARAVLALIEDLEEHDDVQGVSANFDIPDQILQAIQE